jgi:hypothetical protein
MPEVLTSPSLRQQERDNFVAIKFRACLGQSTVLLAEAVDIADSSGIDKAGEAYDETLKKLTEAFWLKPDDGLNSGVLWLGHAHSMAKVLESSYVRPGDSYSCAYPDIAGRSFGTALSLVKKNRSMTVESRAKFGLVLADGMKTVRADRLEEVKLVVGDLCNNIDPANTSSWVIGELARSDDWEDETNRLAGSAMLELMSDYTRNNQPQPQAEPQRPLRAALGSLAGLLPEFSGL